MDFGFGYPFGLGESVCRVCPRDYHTILFPTMAVLSYAIC